MRTRGIAAGDRRRRGLTFRDTSCVQVPEVQYIRSGDVHIAYQVFGDGPDLVYSPGGWNHLLVRWEYPPMARFFRRLGAFARVIMWDKRGTGMSDRHGHIPTLDSQLDDLRAVQDAAGSDAAAMFGLADGAVLVALYAATYPERVRAAILMGMSPRFMPGPDGLGTTAEFLETVRAGGEPDRMLEIMSPEQGDDPVLRDWWRRQAMMAASPGTVAEFMRIWTQVDVTSILGAVRVPTKVIQRADDLVVSPPPNGRVVAELIPGARYVELPGHFATWAGDMDVLADEIEEAATGVRHSADPDRMLASILFTDIVSSTTRAAEVGDAAWRTLLDAHDALMRRQVDSLGGHLVKSLGDGILATFDSPARAIRCAADLVEGMAARGLELRAGVHTGECERRGDDIGGMAVHIASRVTALAGPGEVLVTGTVRDLVVGSGLEFSDRGEHTLRGVPGMWRVLALTR